MVFQQRNLLQQNGCVKFVKKHYRSIQIMHYRSRLHSFRENKHLKTGEKVRKNGFKICIFKPKSKLQRRIQNHVTHLRLNVGVKFQLRCLIES